MTDAHDLDHVSFAVGDATAWARRLRRELGATPVAGESLPEFRYLLLYLGNETLGGRLELIEPVGDAGFLSRFLTRHGEGPHHLTFVVPDIKRAIADVRDWGGVVVGEELDHVPWREAFVLPDEQHRVVIQLAQTARSFPPPEQLLGSQIRDWTTLPSNRDATDPTWWHEVWEEAPGPAVIAGDIHLRVTDAERSRDLFGEILGGSAEMTEHGARYSWPSGALCTQVHKTGGIAGVELTNHPPGGLRIGTARLGGSGDD